MIFRSLFSVLCSLFSVLCSLFSVLSSLFSVFSHLPYTIQSSKILNSTIGEMRSYSTW